MASRTVRSAAPADTPSSAALSVSMPRSRSVRSSRTGLSTSRAPGNRPAGVVYAYQGSPSWIFVYLYPVHRSERYRAELVTRSGRRVPLPSMRIDPATGSGGQATRADLRGVASVRLVGATPDEALEADVPAT